MRFTLLATIVAAVTGQTYNITVQPGAGNGICSQGNVTSFNYNVTSPSPGLTAVLACSTASYNALINANLSDPSTANLPAPLLDMSCTTPNITTCDETFPANRKLIAQVMCILLKNDNSDPITAELDVNFTYASNSSSPTTGASSDAQKGAVMGVVSIMMVALTMAWM